MADREIRYCVTDDGVSIAYSVEGDERHPPLVWIPGWVSHVELDGQTRDTLGVTAILGPVRFITFDKRGTGLSGRGIADFSLDAHLRDISAVVDDLGLGAFALAGYSEGGPVAMGFAAYHPERVTHLTIVGSFADGSRLMGSPEINQAMLTVVKGEWGIGSQFMASLFLGDDSYASPSVFASYQRSAAEPADAYAAFEAILALDVRPLLPRITAPSLVLHTREDRAVPIELGQQIAAGIRGARFSSLPGAHVPSRDVWKQINAAMIEFVTGTTQTMQPAMPAADPPTPSRTTAASGTAVIMFTDIVDSTALTERLGDARFREASRALDAGLRSAIHDAGGAAVDGKLLGDGVLATFPSAAQAIDGARRCVALSAASELGLHIGLHAGDVIREEDNVFGGAVNIAARICALSAPGEILVSDVVRGMARTSAGVAFDDRGEQAMKGVGEPVRVYVVRGQP